MPTLRRASRHQRPHHRHTLKLQSTTEAATKFHGQRVILSGREDRGSASDSIPDCDELRA
jgi:hypothetical protein